MRSGVKLTWLVVTLGGLAALATAQQFPLWEQLLHHYGGTTDETPVPSMKMGDHMQMSLKGKAQPGDAARAQDIVVAARDVLQHYADVGLALHDGYRPFYPSGRIGEEVHYTNYRFARRERTQHVDYRQPGSILYRRTADGMKAAGVMYTAPRDSTPEQLDAIAPLSIATWHRHVDFCGGPKGLSRQEQFGAGARFGPQGSIHTEAECTAAGGLWIPVVFGWMTHVYPDDQEIWAGMDMHMESNAGAPDMHR
jgi:hypothetical protein